MTSAARGEPSPAATPLRQAHELLGATMTAFAGWLMPLRYSSEAAEHRAVRAAAGLFDLSHMGEIAVTGPGAAAALDYALTGRLSTLDAGRARYTIMCAPDGGVLDDLIVYRLGEEEFLVVANAANTELVAGELTARAAGHIAAVDDRTAAYALIAIQGPRAAAVLGPLTHPAVDDLRYYACRETEVAGTPVLAARTGYTGEDGFELFASAAAAPGLWHALLTAGEPAGLIPAGLAARDTLRLEAGMPLYGNELSREVTPFDAGLGRVVVFGKPADFVGRAALAARAGAPAARELTGLVTSSRRIPRHGYPVAWDGRPQGVVTSGAPSPTLGHPVAMAYLDPGTARAAREAPGERLTVDIRGEPVPARVTALPFYTRPR